MLLIPLVVRAIKSGKESRQLAGIVGLLAIALIILMGLTVNMPKN
jgi:hypothetical protein